MAQEKWLVDDEKVIDLENIHSLKVSLIGGSVNIVGHDDPGTRVEVHSVRGKALRIAVDGDRLEVDHPQLSWDNFIEVFSSFTGRASADVSIMVPRDVALKFGVVNATALISGLHGNGTMSTVSGELVLDGIQGDVQLNSVSGEISVRNHTGKVAAHTVSGDVTVTGAVSAFSSDGVSGDVFLDLSGVPDDVKVNTVSGAVNARLDEAAPCAYTISTVSGRLQLDASQITGVRGRWTGKYGTLDQRWLDFRANTVSGDVSVLHAVRTPAAAS